MSESKIYMPPTPDWSLVPEHMQFSMYLYLEHGLHPGGFLTAVLSNDLRLSIFRADAVNKSQLSPIVTFLWEYAPSDCWGSSENFYSWIECGGSLGLERRNPEIKTLRISFERDWDFLHRRRRLRRRWCAVQFGAAKNAWKNQRLKNTAMVKYMSDNPEVPILR